MKITRNFRISQVILCSLLFIDIFLVFKEIGLLYLIYNDNYFYNLDFLPVTTYLDKIHKYQYFYYIYPFFAGIILMVLLKFILRLKWLSFVIGMISSLLLFWFLTNHHILLVFQLEGGRLILVSQLIISILIGVFISYKIKSI